MADRSDDERKEESRRILDRVSREVDGGSLLMRASDGLRKHITAKDGEAEDSIEYWGTRIGRVLGLILCALLIGRLVLFLIHGG